MTSPRWKTLLLAAAISALLVSRGDVARANPAAGTSRHFAANGNFDRGGRFLPGDYGFNIADVSGARQLAALPKGVLGLMWIGSCDGADDRFRAVANSVIDNPKLFGFYLMDDPDPSGRWRPLCSVENLRAEADWIHRRRPTARAFVALMNVGDAAKPDFDPAFRPENSHIDLFGVGPYPCRRDWLECDYDMIERYLEAARRAGLPADAIVPVYQTFGGGEWRSEGGGYRLPKPAEMDRLFQTWRKFLPAPVFDYAYSWGSQKSDAGLSSARGLLPLFKLHNER